MPIFKIYISRRSIYTLFLLLCSICSCNMSRKDPAKLWFYTYNSGDAKDDSTLAAASFLNIKKDGSYTRDFGNFDYGKWTFKNGVLDLSSNISKSTTLHIKYVDAHTLQINIAPNNIANFDAGPIDASGKTDPFSLLNNKWRIKATRKESEDEIRARVHNHCRFWEAYFTWALDNKIETVDVRSTASPIKIYGNGFTLKPYNELPSQWRELFFDTEDCRIANNLIYEVMQYHTIAWPQTDNRYKAFISAFQQMQQFLR